MPKKVLILVEEGFRDEEVFYPYYRFIEAEYDVKIVGPDIGKIYKGKFGLSIKSNLASSGVDLNNVIILIIPGGFAPDKMRINQSMVDLVKEAFEANKIIASICHGGWLLVEADIIKGKDVTGYRATATDLRNAGGNYIDKNAVVDGNLVTSRIPDDLPVFCKSILKLAKTYNKQ